MSEVTRRVFLVGESNPYSTDPRYALYPLPANASGGRLARILGMQATEYLRAFERRDLLSGKWSAPEARVAANTLRGELRDGEALVLLGTKVAAAFGYVYEPLTRHRGLVHGEVGYEVLLIPHPSGLNRAWHDPAMAPRVRAAVNELRGV